MEIFHVLKSRHGMSWSFDHKQIFMKKKGVEEGGWALSKVCVCGGGGVNKWGWAHPLPTFGQTKCSYFAIFSYFCS